MISMENWVVVSNIFYFHPYLGNIPILTNIFQRGWNHQLENLEFIFPVSASSFFFGESQPPDERPAGCGEAIVVSHEVGRGRDSVPLSECVSVFGMKLEMMSKAGISSFRCLYFIDSWYMNHNEI